MAPQIGPVDVDYVIHKRSAIADKDPLPGQLENGEISVNYHATAPFLAIKLTDGSIFRIGGTGPGVLEVQGAVDATAAGPTPPLRPGDVYLNTGTGAPDGVWGLPPGTTLAGGESLMWFGGAWQMLGGGGSGGAVPDADTSTKGIVRLGTVAETIAGMSAALAVTPAGLESRQATTLKTGLVELATTKETADGIDAQRAVTPAGLATVLAALGALSVTGTAPVVVTTTAQGFVISVPVATTTDAGLFSAADKAKLDGLGVIPWATPAEVTAGTVGDKAVSPQALAQATLTAGTF